MTLVVKFMEAGDEGEDAPRYSLSHQCGCGLPATADDSLVIFRQQCVIYHADNYRASCTTGTITLAAGHNFRFAQNWKLIVRGHCTCGCSGAAESGTRMAQDLIFRRSLNERKRFSTPNLLELKSSSVDQTLYCFSVLSNAAQLHHHVNIHPSRECSTPVSGNMCALIKRRGSSPVDSAIYDLPACPANRARRCGVSMP
jgi:hypothetical protein